LSNIWPNKTKFGSSPFFTIRGYLNQASSDSPKSSVVLTGASGFVGVHVVKHLRNQGIKVLPLSRSRSNGDFVSISDYANAPEGGILIHLAQDNNRVRVNQKKNAVVESEVLLRQLLSKKYQRVVYASSAAVYGDKDSNPQKPSQKAMVIDNYTEIKSISEHAVMNCGRGVVARLSNLYGVGMSFETVLGTILRQIPGTGPMRVHDVNPVRDFLWVEDAAAAICSLAMGRVTGIYNVGSGIGTSIGQLAELCLKLSGEGQRKVASELESSEMSHLVLNIKDTIKDSNWRPKVILAAGVKQLLSERVKEAI
jgi:UDP-glucose 4-epimerase